MLIVDSVSELSRDIVFGQQCPRVSRRLHRAQRSLAATLPLSRASFAYLVASCTLPSKWWVCTPVAFAPVPISTFHRSSQSHVCNRVCHFCCRPKFQRVQTPTYIHSHGRNGHGSVGVGREDTGTGVSRATGLGKKARHPEKGSSSTQNKYIFLESVPSTAPSLICHSLNV